MILWRLSDHLFFTCPYSSTTWSSLTKGLLRAKYSSQCNDVIDLKFIDLISDSRQSKLLLFLVRHTFQTMLHTIWREKNSRNHGEESILPHKLVQHICKQIRNCLSSIRGKLSELDKEAAVSTGGGDVVRLLDKLHNSLKPKISLTFRISFSMASSSSSQKLLVKVNLLGKRKWGDGLEEHKETSHDKEVVVTTKTLFIANVHNGIGISDIIDFFKDVVRVVRVRLVVNLLRRHRRYGYVEFASAKEAKKALLKKNGECLGGLKIHLSVPRRMEPFPPPKQYCLDHKVCYEDELRESLLMEEDEAVGGLEGVLFVANLSPQTKIFHVKEFFNDVGEVARVRLIVNHELKHVGYGFVEFASANEAKKALEKKNGKYLHDHKIFLYVAKNAPYPPRPRYNLAEKLCYEDYLRRQEGEIVEGLDETPDFVEAVAVREKTVFVSHLSNEANISDIIDFFNIVGEIVHVRLVVDNTGERVGNAFLEFASAQEAKKALEKKNGKHFLGQKIFICVAKKAPYPLRPKYCVDHKVWYEDYLRRKNLLIDEDEGVEGLDIIEEVAARKKTIFVSNIRRINKISYIIRFFKKVGQVVRLRLIVDHSGERVECCFAEFASADEAEKALEMKRFDWSLDVAEMAPYPHRPRYKYAEKLWSKVESHLIKDKEEEEEEEGEEEYEYDDDDDFQEVPLMDIFCGKKITFYSDY